MKYEGLRFSQGSFFMERGDPTLRSASALREKQRRCTMRNNPNTFFATVDTRKPLEIVWSHNATAYFGVQTLTSERFFSAVHPFWRSIYKGGLDFVIRNVLFLQEGSDDTNPCITISVPLKGETGGYFWFNQVSFQGSFDAKGLMVESFNEFHRLAEFDRLAPERPRLSCNENENEAKAHDLELKIYYGRLLGAATRRLMTTTNFKVLEAYRLREWNQFCTDRQGIADYLGTTLQALDKANLRLLAQARGVFPAVASRSVEDLARFLNSIIGEPTDALKAFDDRTLNGGESPRGANSNARK